MRDQYRVVVIDGGVVEASALHRLAKPVWSDVAIIERSALTAETRWHAGGGVHALDADPNTAALQPSTIDLLSEIEVESGHELSLHMIGGISVASAPVPSRGGTNAPGADRSERANVDR
jgi:dimethylglycine dehydrogenase